MLLATLDDESTWTAQTRERLVEEFKPIFFHYPRGLQDSSKREPRETGMYSSKWRQLAALREQIRPGANDHSVCLSKEEVDCIWTRYFEDFKTTLRPEQRNKKWTYHKSRFESKLRTDAGSKLGGADGGTCTSCSVADTPGGGGCSPAQTRESGAAVQILGASSSP